VRLDLTKEHDLNIKSGTVGDFHEFRNLKRPDFDFEVLSPISFEGSQFIPQGRINSATKNFNFFLNLAF